MTHDKFCDSVTKHSYFPCTCSFIQAIRQDEREQAAQKIEAHAQKVLKAGENIMYFDGFIDSAAIARGDSK